MTGISTKQNTRVSWYSIDHSDKYIILYTFLLDNTDVQPNIELCIQQKFDFIIYFLYTDCDISISLVTYTVLRLQQPPTIFSYR